MFGRHPCLAIDAILGIGSSEVHKSHQDYVDQLTNYLRYAYEKTEIEARKKGKKYKKYYDKEAISSLLMPGDRVLVLKYLGEQSIYSDFVCLFDSLRPINNLSVKQGPVFLG